MITHFNIEEIVLDICCSNMVNLKQNCSGKQYNSSANYQCFIISITILVTHQLKKRKYAISK